MSTNATTHIESITTTTNTVATTTKPQKYHFVRRLFDHAYLACCASSFFYGIVDALSIHNTFLYIFALERLRTRIFHCLLLNGLIFIGSLCILNYILIPIFNAVATAGVPASFPILPNVIVPALHSLIYMIWIYPIYVISFILNALWYVDIAECAYKFQNAQLLLMEDSKSSALSPSPTHSVKTTSSSQSFSFTKWVETMAEELYRLLLITSFLIQCVIISFVPYIGSWLSIIHYSWLHALYSFEYKWSLEGWKVETRIEYFERRWAYFCGFGLPAALIGYFFPKWIGSGFFALTFPLFIILAVNANPVPMLSVSKVM